MAPWNRRPRPALPRRSRSRSSRSRPPRPRRTTSEPHREAAAAPGRARRPVALAVTGGIGAGKSALLRAFARHGAAVSSSDEIVHRLLAEDPAVRQAVVERLGDGVLGPDGRIDRAAVGRIVFATPGKLAWLEELLHPLVAESQRRWRDELAARPDPPAVCAIEVPLLYETGGEVSFDAVVVVTASPATRAARTVVADVPLRERRLLADEEKVRRADFAYVNDGTLEELDAFAASVIARLTG